MRFLIAILALALSYGWIVLLDNPVGTAPPLGKFFGPIKGFWKNAVPTTEDGSEITLPTANLKSRVDVTFDARLVPHITARNNEDLYFSLGYIHAYYRLWQMDMQARAAAGRLSEVAGAKTIDYDRLQRRKGMVFAAKNALVEIESNQLTKSVLDAYTEGVNAYIESLRFMDFPVEYKMMNFEPEAWSNLKSVLIIKFMADKLTGHSEDIANSYLRQILSEEEFNLLFPEKVKFSEPVIPEGTLFGPASEALPGVPSGNLWAKFRLDGKVSAFTKDIFQNPNQGIGSNNWAISPDFTKDGGAILCNDPHLPLNLPSLWYEVQLTSPEVNVYGASLPGLPSVVIGFNDSIAWGVTNNARDVKDFYEITQAKDPRYYIFDGEEVLYNKYAEAIYIKDSVNPLIDTVKYTIHGPVIYDERFQDKALSKKRIAVSWMAHEPSNELFSFIKLNRSSNYKQFVSAIQFFACPAQNFVYADRIGNIALWAQGRFINKWKNQGNFVMDGSSSRTLWGDTIPAAENPHVLNPAQGFVASANQNISDAAYPYWYNGDFAEFRSWILNRTLRQSTSDSLCEFTVDDMFKLQTSNYSFLAEEMIPFVERYLHNNFLRYDTVTSNLKYELFPKSKNATFFAIFWEQLKNNLWSYRFNKYPFLPLPSDEITYQIIMSDSSLANNTKSVQYYANAPLVDLISKSYSVALDSFNNLSKRDAAEWYKVKNTSITHLSKQAAFSFDQLKTGGDGHTLNAMRHDQGPSWRMVVDMNPNGVRAYGVYPGGQSGHPGSKFYDNFIKKWEEGTYYRLSFQPRKLE